MSCLSQLKEYNLSQSTLNKLLKVYYYEGKNEFYKVKIENKLVITIEEALKKLADTIVESLNINVTKERRLLIIFKDSVPRNKEEERVKNVKDCLYKIYQDAFMENHPLNSVDILDYIKEIMNDKKVTFSKSEFVIQKERNTIRYFFNQLLDDLNDSLKLKKAEEFTALSFTIMELINMKPYTNYNELAGFILELYYLFRFKLLGLFLKDNLTELYKTYNIVVANTIKGSSNYDMGSLYYKDVLEYYLDLTIKAYSDLDVIVREEDTTHAYKSDLLRVYILKDLPKTFTKGDIKDHFKEVSETTIVRALNELKDEGYIIPLGTGRSAKWCRIKDEEVITFSEE